MAKPPRAKAAPSPVGDDKRRRFDLTDQQSETVRSAIESTTTDDDVIAKTWARFGAELGFVPESLVLIDMPETGVITFSAELIGDEALAAEELAMETDDGTARSEDDDEQHGIDHEELTNAGLRKMEEAADNLDLASATLAGDLTRGLLEIVQNIQKPWSAHSQGEKRDLVAKLETCATKVVRGAVDVVAADERMTITAVLEKVSFGDKTMITLKLGAMSEDETAEAINSLVHSQKKHVLIVTADSDRHMSKRREIVEPDDMELPFDAGKDTLAPTDDELDAKALAVLKPWKNVSSSMLQREMRIGYNSAVAILERLEKAGAVSAPDESGARTVTIVPADDSDLAGENKPADEDQEKVEDDDEPGAEPNDD